jgi:hypothetical protein
MHMHILLRLQYLHFVHGPIAPYVDGYKMALLDPHCPTQLVMDSLFAFAFAVIVCSFYLVNLRPARISVSHLRGPKPESFWLGELATSPAN